MAAISVNGYILLPNLANWAQPVTWQRAWQTGIASGLPGNEGRQGLRALARESLAFSITALSTEDRVRLDEQIDQATVTGLACAPRWGRACTLNADATGTSAVMTDTVWPWAIGDYIYFLNTDNMTYDVKHVTNVAGATLTLDSALSQTYTAGSFVWPMIFGKFTLSKEDAISTEYGEAKITIAELSATHQQVIGNPPGAPGTGIGSWLVGSTNIIS